MRSRTPILVLAGSLGLAAFGAAAVRLADDRRAAAAWSRLSRLGATTGTERFEPAMVTGLPAPARRWFLRALPPGAELRTVAEIEMEGELGLGTLDDPRYLPMRARQILAPPHGFVWIPRMGRFPMRISGSDGHAPDGAWTRFWLLGLVPVARAADTPDLVRSAAARGIAEAALWLPAALLPGEGVTWDAMDDRHARVTLRHGADSYPVELEIAEDGRLLSVRMMRWSDANPERVFRWQPFGGTVTGWGSFGGITIAAAVEAGNHFGTPDYFPFYRARVLDLRLR
jgi:hypothetical protein